MTNLKKRKGGIFGSVQPISQPIEQKNNQSVKTNSPPNPQSTEATNKPLATTNNTTPQAKPNPQDTEQKGWFSFLGFGGGKWRKTKKTKKGGFTPPSTSSVTGVAAGAKMTCKQALGIASSKCKGGSRKRNRLGRSTRLGRSIRSKK
jgi:hypothetical protein